MRNTLTMAIAGSLLASVASAQQPPPPPAFIPTAGWVGSIDFGARLNAVTGDQARFERFGDVRDGASTRITLGKETAQYAFSAEISNIGYRDQRYEASYDRQGRVKFTFLWDSTPFNYAYNSSTPWVEQSPGVFTLDRTARLLVQNRAPGVVGVAASAAQLATPSIFRDLASPLDIQSRRDTASFAGTLMATRELAINFSFASTNRTGHEPKGASFGFNVASQVAAPIDTRTNDLSAAAEWLGRQAMFRVAWDGSWFRNGIHELLVDNPVRADDTSPIDYSGYASGRGAAQSRFAAAPDNSLNTISATGLYKLPGHSNVNGTVSFATMRQNDTLIPWTSSKVIDSPAVFALFPGLASLPRSTADAKVEAVNALLTYTTRPNRFFGFTTRYRYNDHRNLTPMFDGTDYVRMDAVPEETGGPTRPFNVRQSTFDVNASFNVAPRTDLRLGYTLDDAKRTGRELSDSTDYTFRATLDTVGGPYVMVRLIYENSHRVGTGLSLETLEEAGFQPGLRTYDVADRDRDRGWLVVTLTPASIFDVSFSLAAARDRYRGDGHQFGLLDNDNTVFNVTANLRPVEKVLLGANYGRDSYDALMKARNASPLGTDYGSWIDPNRDWLLDQDEKVDNVSVYLDLLQAIARTDIRLSYDYSDSNNAYIHSGPRIQELMTSTAFRPGAPRPCTAPLTSCFEPLPTITNTWQRLKADVTYMFSRSAGLGFGYWFEKFDVSDYATVDLQPGTPRIDYLGVIGTGYGNRPYKANTGFFRILYLF